ncbi:NAD-P-binding protein [Mycena rebaudengoi]|nr:NAD-P-binding protein [Mycena rebaudengoi]
MGNLLPTFFSSHVISERDIPDLSGKIILVTGGNSGIGYETVKQLLVKNAKVYLAARSAEKAAKAINSLEEETKKRAIFIPLDLADLHSVRRAAEAFLAQEKRLDILFNNGGVMGCPPDMFTLQNHDLQFGTNVIGHYFLTELLVQFAETKISRTQLPALITSYNETRLAANAGVELESLKGGPSRDAWLKKNGSFMAPWRLYGESKLGNILVSNYFARVHSDVLVSTALHPGGIRSELARHRPGWQQMGAYTQLWAGTVATLAQITGQYLIPWAKVGKASKSASDTKLEA